MVVYKAIILSLRSERSVFFLDAPGRTGKISVINSQQAKLHRMKHIALAVDSRGITPFLQSGGYTDHSCFKLPLDLPKKEKANCNTSRGSIKCKILDGKLLVGHLG